MGTSETADTHCPECGAALTGDGITACQDLFHAALALEWADPPHTYAAHHLLVATYMLQHPAALTPEAVAWYEAGVIAIVDEGLSAPVLRERNRGRLDQQKRDWNVHRREAAAPQLQNWSATIADIVPGPAPGLPDRIWRWARRVREDLRGRGAM